MFDLQFFASKKGVGSTKNGRDSRPKYRGAKLSDGQFTNAGQIIYRQKGNLIYPGKNVGQGNDFTLFALKSGWVRYEPFGKGKKRVLVLENR
ncbi:ribosomal protein L27 [Mycoplasma haemofelis str. Langford 1]|uniref:Large ribosomal subunit protein bL27 n=2 Tax=Mycoplasma haemofelis TaxID=29501 RepID=F6FGN7_MYCHI|nr:50S ribosomal protein L27 [Mycoplasma haemofelis]AEG72560.1 50S ribosomal protein L27 [Mycoplasma haemofelis Ohio2]CBY92247.1 ribosomal protein L27 [Mycoplasma haemofelis str. Langford 1]